MANKVKFGLKGVRVFPITAETDGKPTYGEAIAVPGAVNLTLDPSGTENKFDADNVVYYRSVANNGYEGNLEIALLPEAFLIEILGFQKDDAGVVVESADAKPKEFAMTYQIDGDAENRKMVLYRCSASRPNAEASTITDTKTPQTDAFDFAAMSRIDNGFIKAHAEESSTAYPTFDTAVYEPVFTTTAP